MDRMRTNATLFAEHSARIKRTLRRAPDTRVVSRSRTTPILLSPLPQPSRRPDGFSPLLCCRRSFFPSIFPLFPAFLLFSTVKVSSSAQTSLQRRERERERERVFEQRPYSWPLYFDPFQISVNLGLLPSSFVARRLRASHKNLRLSSRGVSSPQRVASPPPSLFATRIPRCPSSISPSLSVSPIHMRNRPRQRGLAKN